MSNLLFCGIFSFVLGAFGGGMLVLLWLGDDIKREKRPVRRTQPYKIIIAGNYGQFENWVHSHIIHAYAEQHLIGRDLNECEFIKVGDWRNSPVLDRLPFYMTKERWEGFLDDPVY